MPVDPNNTKVIVGISGGVDSAVAALLLVQSGYHVEGLFMKNWEEDDRDGQCSAEQDLADAQKVCDRLNIPLHTANFSAEYWDFVFEHFLSEHRAGRTPNPDILCNREIKFKRFFEHAQSIGADKIATGHYASISTQQDTFFLDKGHDSNKDQSYFLYTLGQAQLRDTLFPLGRLPKTEVRELAQAAGFENAAKKDSTGICFIGERNFRTFLQRFLPMEPGEIVTPQGTCIGRHQGLAFYTIGQRQGLGIGGMSGATSGAWYVAKKDLTNNRLVAVQGTDHPLLFNQQLRAIDPHWIHGLPTATTQLSCTAKTRYRQPDQACQVNIDQTGALQVKFDQAQRALTPGQSIVFYQGNRCLGGAIIDTAE